MRKPALLSLVLLLGLAAGCNQESAGPTPSPSPTEPPAPTPTDVETPTTVPTSVPTADATIAGPASCVVEPFDFPVVSGMSPVMEADQTYGPADASITFIEYADFQ